VIVKNGCLDYESIDKNLILHEWSFYMHATTSIGYQPVPLDDYDVLQEVVTITSDKTNQTALEIFGKYYQEITQIQHRLSIGIRINATVLVTFMISGTVIMFSGISITDRTITNILMVAGSIVCGLSLIPSCLCPSFNYSYRQSGNFLNQCEGLADFSNNFESFRLSPSEIGVRKLFENLKAIESGEWAKLVPEKNLSLFKETGKLFLMDAVAAFLKEKDENSKFARQWKETFELTLHSKVSNANAEPWFTLGISNPDLNAYHDLDNRRLDVISNNFPDKLVEVFKEMMDEVLNNDNN
jgi:hypothetical protein